MVGSGATLPVLFGGDSSRRFHSSLVSTPGDTSQPLHTPPAPTTVHFQLKASLSSSAPGHTSCQYKPCLNPLRALLPFPLPTALMCSSGQLPGAHSALCTSSTSLCPHSLPGLSPARDSSPSPQYLPFTALGAGPAYSHGMCMYMCTLRFLRQGLSLNQELTNSATLAGQQV